MRDNEATLFVNYEKTERESAQKQAQADFSLDQAYLELGRAYYEGKFEDPLPELLPLFDRITAIRREQERATYVCPACGVQVKAEDVFCRKCGHKIR